VIAFWGLLFLLFWRITGILGRSRSTPGGLDPSAWAPLEAKRQGDEVKAKLAKLEAETVTPSGRWATELSRFV
jgi:hypothetical protein